MLSFGLMETSYNHMALAEDLFEIAWGKLKRLCSFNDSVHLSFIRALTLKIKTGMCGPFIYM